MSHNRALRGDACGSMARTVAYAAATHHNTSSVSVLLVRLMTTVIGVSARISAARSATFSPAQRRTVRCSRKTAAAPSST